MSWTRVLAGCASLLAGWVVGAAPSHAGGPPPAVSSNQAPEVVSPDGEAARAGDLSDLSGRFHLRGRDGSGETRIQIELERQAPGRYTVRRETRRRDGSREVTVGAGRQIEDRLQVRFEAPPAGIAGALLQQPAAASGRQAVAHYIFPEGRIAGLVRFEGGDESFERGVRRAPATTSEQPTAEPPSAPSAESPDREAAVQSGDIGGRIAAIARAHEGLGFGGAEERRLAYARFLFPHDTAYNQTSFAGHMSSCGLFAMSCLRELGLPHRRLDTPYASQIGRAVANVIEIGRDEEAWIDVRTRARLDAAQDPDVGDVVIIGLGADPSWGGTEHVFVIVAKRVERAADGREVTVYVSVDGGQTDRPRGYQILERQRVLERVNGQLWARGVSQAGADQLTRGRRVMGWLDCSQLDPASLRAE
jgi:hypothetical protein